MPTLATWLAFAALCTAMVATPGPNRMYLVSRSLCQGPRAGFVALGFVVWMLLAAFGITAMLVAVPFQRWLMGGVLGSRAMWMLVEARR